MFVPVTKFVNVASYVDPWMPFEAGNLQMSRNDQPFQFTEGDSFNAGGRQLQSIQEEAADEPENFAAESPEFSGGKPEFTTKIINWSINIILYTFFNFVIFLFFMYRVSIFTPCLLENPR